MTQGPLPDVFKWLAHQIVAIPRVYDLSQTLAGSRKVRRHLERCVQSLSPPISTVLDVGGGTGINRAIWPGSVSYVCMDPDPRMLAGFKAKHPGGAGILGEGARMPVHNKWADLLLLTCVLHHLSRDAAPAILRECGRVLKPEGKLVIVEPLKMPRRLVSRLLWHLDRGSFPRDEETLRQAVGADFEILHWERFRPLHEFVLCVAQKKG